MSLYESNVHFFGIATKNQSQAEIKMIHKNNQVAIYKCFVHIAFEDDN